MSLGLRLTGSILILTGSIGMGWSLVMAGQNQLANMQRILYQLTRMNGEIGFGRLALPQVCRQCADSGKDAFAEALRQVAERMEANQGEAFPTIWREVMDLQLKGDTVPKEFKTCLLELGERLGMVDAQLTGKMLQETCMQLEQVMQRYREQLENRNRVRISLSMGTGMTILLLLW